MTEQKIVVTDSMVELVRSALKPAKYTLDYDFDGRIKSALEAVFELVNKESAEITEQEAVGRLMGQIEKGLNNAGYVKEEKPLDDGCNHDEWQRIRSIDTGKEVCCICWKEFEPVSADNAQLEDIAREEKLVTLLKKVHQAALENSLSIALDEEIEAALKELGIK